MPRRLPNPWVRAVVGGAAVVALSYLMGVGRYNGAGMGVITAAVEQGQALPWDFICKILLTALTLSAGFKGGEVVPSFYIGATFGCAFGPLLGLPAGFSAAVGLVSVFCGATNTLIPSILLAYVLAVLFFVAYAGCIADLIRRRQDDALAVVAGLLAAGFTR